MLCALQCREKERERCQLFRKRSVWSWFCVSPNQHYPDETQAVRRTWSRKKRFILFACRQKKNLTFRKKEWEKNWPPVNTPQLQLIFIQMLTPINRWHNVLLHFLFCSALSKCWRSTVWITWENVCFCACGNRHIVSCWSSQPLDLTPAYTGCFSLLSWTVFQCVQHQGTAINTDDL